MYISPVSKVHTMRILNRYGDVTIGWTDDQAPMMEEIIARKMEEGFTFFILDGQNKEIRLRNPEELKNIKSVTIGDKEAELLIRDGKIGIVTVVDNEVESEVATTRRTRNPKEAAASNTAAVAPSRGG